MLLEIKFVNIWVIIGINRLFVVKVLYFNIRLIIVVYII